MFTYQTANRHPTANSANTVEKSMKSSRRSSMIQLLVVRQQDRQYVTVRVSSEECKCVDVCVCEVERAGERSANGKEKKKEKKKRKKFGHPSYIV